MSLTGPLFVFNPNTGAPTEQLNVNFQLLALCTQLIGGGVVYSPAQITSNQNDYSTLDTDNQIVGILRLDSNSAINITGLANGQEGRTLCIINVGSNNISLTDQDASSVAANRIITGTGASIVLVPDDIAKLVYDATTARWRVTNASIALWG